MIAPSPLTADNNVLAYDAITGKQLWAYVPKLGFSNLCCGQISRGVAVAYGKVFSAQLDGHVVALDARTGKLLWQTDHANALPAPAYFYSFTIAPLVYNGLVLVGIELLATHRGDAPKAVALEGPATRSSPISGSGCSAMAA